MPTCSECHVSQQIMGDNEIKPEAVHGPSGTYFKAQESPRKPQLGDRKEGM